MAKRLSAVLLSLVLSACAEEPPPEVSDSLNQFYKAGESLQAQLALEKAASEYLQLARKRYRNGVLAYLDVLDAQRRLFEAQISVSFGREDQFFALVDLYKALGGGWDPEALRAIPDVVPEVIRTAGFAVGSFF